MFTLPRNTITTLYFSQTTQVTFEKIYREDKKERLKKNLEEGCIFLIFSFIVKNQNFILHDGAKNQKDAIRFLKDFFKSFFLSSF